MPAFNHDVPFVPPGELPAPNFASVLLVDLDVIDEPIAVQRRTVAEWLETHEPSPALATSLERAGLVPGRERRTTA
jgi:hypothetical protein